MRRSLLLKLLAPVIFPMQMAENSLALGDTPGSAGIAQTVTVEDGAPSSTEAGAYAAGESSSTAMGAAAASQAADASALLCASDAGLPSAGDAAMGDPASGEGSASFAAGAPASDISSSAAHASRSTDSAAGAVGDEHASFADPAPTVGIDVEDHAEARERFAGLMAKIHELEGASVDELKLELHAIGELLHLHSLASHQAAQTGSYSPSDL